VRFFAYLLLSWFLNAVVLAFVAWLFTDVTRGTTKQLLIAAAVFGVLNTILKPIMKLVTLPLAIITLGIVWFGVSMLMLKLTDVLVKGFNIEGFWTLVWATAVVWFLNAIIDGLMFLRQRPTGGGSDAVAMSH
jgi:putative membrane protein